ncbi:MAG: YggT family protein [Gammaproteobacteria bacterium]
MGSSYYTNPLIFLIETFFNLYILAVLLRFLLQWANADFYNPISQFLVKITHPPLKILRRAIPAIGRIDTASLVFMILLQMISGWLVFVLKGSGAPIEAVFVWAIMELISLLINLFVVLILVEVVLSWVNPGTYNAATSLIYYLTEPLLRMVRRVIPPLGGIDFSPLVVLVALQLVKMLLFPPMIQLISILS